MIRIGLKSMVRKPLWVIVLYGVLSLFFIMLLIGFLLNSALETSKVWIRNQMGAVVTYGINYYEDDDWMNYSIDKLLQTRPSMVIADRIQEDPVVEAYFPVHQGRLSVSGYDVDYWYVDYVNHIEPIEFYTQRYHLVHGRLFTEEEIQKQQPVIVITTHLYQTYQIQLGDTIKVVDWFNGIMEPSQEFVDAGLDEMPFTYYEVIGVFEGATPYEKLRCFMPMAPHMYIEDVNGRYPDATQVYFYLSEPSLVHDFIDHYQAYLPGDHMALTAGRFQYDQLIAPLDFILLVLKVYIAAVIISGSIWVFSTICLIRFQQEREIFVWLSDGISLGALCLRFMISSAFAWIASWLTAVGFTMHMSSRIAQWIMAILLQKQYQNNVSTDEIWYMLPDVGVQHLVNGEAVMANFHELMTRGHMDLFIKTGVMLFLGLMALECIWVIKKSRCCHPSKG